MSGTLERPCAKPTVQSTLLSGSFLLSLIEIISHNFSKKAGFVGRDENISPNGRRQRRQRGRRPVLKAQSGRRRLVEKLSGRRQPVQKLSGQR